MDTQKVLDLGSGYTRNELDLGSGTRKMSWILNDNMTLFTFFKHPNVHNKYAIHAYTHGPVTGSGPSVKPLKYVTHLLVAS